MHELGKDTTAMIRAKKPSRLQPTLGFSKMTPERSADLNLQSAMALYMGGLAFQTFATVWMKDFLQNLSFKSWTPPTRQRFADDLLDKCYETVKVKVDAHLKAIGNSGNKYHFIIDESTDRASRRMVNLSVVERGVRSFFLINKDSKDADLDAQYFLRWFYEQTKPYTDGKLFRIGSMTTDTCSTMRLFWQLAEKTSELAHVIFVPCDSHGLQLLIKDLCEMPFFKIDS